MQKSSKLHMGGGMRNWEIRKLTDSSTLGGGNKLEKRNIFWEEGNVPIFTLPLLVIFVLGV